MERIGSSRSDNYDPTNIENRDLQSRKDLGENVSEQERWALDALCQIGLLKNVSDQELYHGRKSDGSTKEWEVDPFFDNGGNNSGNHNVNRIPALNVASKDVAIKFAESRDYQNQGHEVHKIVSDDPMAKIIDLTFDLSKIKHDPQKKDMYFQAMKILLPPVRQGITFDFQEKGKDFFNKLKPEDFNRLKKENGFIENKLQYVENGQPITNKKLRKLAEEKNIDPSVIEKIGGALNMQIAIRYNPTAIMYKFLGDKLNDKDKGVYFDSEYLKNFLKKSHIVGAEYLVDSATLGETIGVTQFFNLYEINSDSKIAEKRSNHIRARNKQLGTLALSASFRDKYEIADQYRDFWDSIENLNSQPRQIISAIESESESAKKLLALDAGNWEGFTIKQHTEAVLQNFENNYADIMPSGLVPLTRLSLLVHDIGKGVAVAKNDKRNQRHYNRFYAQQVMKQLGLNSQMNELICGIITDAQMFTTDVLVHKDQDAIKKLSAYNGNLLKECGFQKIDSNDIDIMNAICKVIQTCDSLAYTTTSIIRDLDGKYLRSSDSFNSNFHQFGFTNEKARWK